NPEDLLRGCGCISFGLQWSTRSSSWALCSLIADYAAVFMGVCRLCWACLARLVFAKCESNFGKLGEILEAGSMKSPPGENCGHGRVVYAYEENVVARTIEATNDVGNLTGANGSRITVPSRGIKSM
ncbi:uncharacterized protein PpBr36_05776, partial [Pyricularia pennisetigena]|uniref:uncharacterized protein n=1 Tax=Pyricularia pennisetigena TaxID=1578925 RepID=UPI0011523B0D